MSVHFMKDFKEQEEFHEHTTLSNMGEMIDEYGTETILRYLQKYVNQVDEQILFELVQHMQGKTFGKGVEL